MKHAHLDFETRSTVDLTKVGADVYSQHHSTDAMCLAYAIGDAPVKLWQPELEAPTELFDFIKEGGTVLGHNIGGFEMLIWNNVMALKYDWPELRISQCQDTMAMAYAMGLPGSLDDASRAAGIAYQKDMAGHRVMLQLCQPRSYTASGEPVWWSKSEFPEKYQTLYDYCVRDVEVERGLDKRLLKLSPQEQRLWELDYDINRRGVYVDMKSAKIALELVESEKTRLNSLIREKTNGAIATCTATGQISDWLKSKGMEVPSIAKADVTEMLSRKDLPQECKEILLLRREAAKTSTAKLQAMVRGASAGGRMRGLFQYHGASTGRWAGRRVQLQNLPRPVMSQADIEKVFTILGNGTSLKLKTEIIRQNLCTPLAAMSDCIRGFLRAKPGHDFIACDFASIEARVLAWLAGEEKTLEVFRGDGKIYELTGADIFGCKKSDIKKDDPRRQVGKTAVLAFGFQGGVGAIQTMCRAYGVKLEPAFDMLWARASTAHKERTDFVYNMNGKKHDISKKEFYASDLTKQFWREANPNIVKYWADLENAAIEAARSGLEVKAGAEGREVTYKKSGSFLWCKLPSGRVICYPYPKVEMKAKFEGSSESETLTYMTVDSYTKKWVRRKCYGGLLSENVTQAVARDLLAEAIFRLEVWNYPVVIHCHDEVVCEVKKDFGSCEDVEEIMTKLPAWAKDLPVDAESWRSERFRK